MYTIAKAKVFENEKEYAFMQILCRKSEFDDDINTQNLMAFIFEKVNNADIIYQKDYYNYLTILNNILN